MDDPVSDVCHRRFPRPPLPRRRRGRAPRPQPAPARRPPAARAHWWALTLRAPVVCARRKGCGAACLYPDHVYDGSRRWR